MRKKVQLGSRGAAIAGLDPDRDVFGVGLGVFDEDVPVAIVIKNAGVEEFVLGARAVAPVLFDQIGIRVLALRIFVKHAHVAVRRSAVEVEPVFLNVLAVDAFVGGKAKHALFQDRVAAVP